ncbi:MAG TPA: hypothetical protein VNC84_06880, partial [Gammaproteobacteria bacterium]|nr:hypothetical protein [Gammaproteobacteria bacterium]
FLLYDIKVPFNGRNVALFYTSFYQIHVTLPHGRGSVTPSPIYSTKPPGGEGMRRYTKEATIYL